MGKIKGLLGNVVFKDLIIILVFSIVVYLLSAFYDLFDRVLAYLLALKGANSEIEEIIMSFIFLSAALGVFSFRRWRELSIEISLRKKFEQELEYLATYDTLTTTYNRNSFEQDINQIDQAGSRPVGVMICDLDGLKLINDTFGHREGDNLLQAAAGLLQRTFSQIGKVYRIGGDEFAVICLNSSAEQLKQAAKVLKQSIDSFNEKGQKVQLSLSSSFAIRDSVAISLLDVVKEADNNMYRHKLHHNLSNRNAIVQTLRKALEARDYITDGHGDRLQQLLMLFANKVSIPERRMDDLRLLAQFHDLGKVGIPDNILFKPGKLTPEEYEYMKRHSEIGYRIALASSELSPIADWILKHHERWDGSGYPLGLVREQIPLECRMLAIVDAFDAMINDRPYRKAMTYQEAIQEIQRCSGTQFDPDLVDIVVRTNILEEVTK